MMYEKIKLNVRNQKVQAVLAEVHEAIMKKKKQFEGGMKNEIIMENRLFSVICQKPDLEPREYATVLNDAYGYNLRGGDVIQLLRQRRMAHPIERKALLEWAEELADLFVASMQGDKASFERLEKKRKESFLGNGKRHDSQERMIVLMLFAKYPEIDAYGDIIVLHLLGNTMAKYCFYEMVDAIVNTYNFTQNREKHGNKKMSMEQALKKITQLENYLERTNTMLVDLQEEFEEQLEESKIKEMTDFFAKLNSEKYGCILDELIRVRKGSDMLRRKHYELPVEISGLLITIKKLIQFIRDSHIEPIMNVNATQEVTLKDIEFCDYEGSPFATADEVKTVKVISPGWIYKDKELQISRPKVKEE